MEPASLEGVPFRDEAVRRHISVPFLMLFYRQGMRFLTRDCVTGAIIFIKGNDMPLNFSMACILKFGPVTFFFN